MPTNYSGRVSLIVAVTLLFLAAIFSPVLKSPAKLFDPSIPFTQKVLVRPGIDMVGGTSLLYEIKAPPGSQAYTGDLAAQMMDALKRRVDPEGVRNLIWRPQGGNRLEIQMPLSGGGDQELVKQRREALLAAQRGLDQTNVRVGEVVAALEGKEGPDRAKLNQLAGGGKARQDLFNQLADAQEAARKGREAKDAAAEAAALIKYDELKRRLGETNLSAEQLEATLPMVSATPNDARVAAQNKQRQQQFDQLKARYAGFPQRQEAIGAYRKAYEDFNSVRQQLDDASDLKRLLKGAGVLEFHILAVPPISGGKSNIQLDEYQQWVDRLQKEGPRTRAGDKLRWFEIHNPEQFKGHMTHKYGDVPYVLGWITPEKSLDNREGRARWKLERAFRTTGQYNEAVVGFAFDAQGGQYFGELTGNNLQEPLAIVLDGRVISAPNINSRITDSGIIEGGQNGFDLKELNYLVTTLAAGSLPAELSEEPIREQTVGPQLGRDNLVRGLIACAFGLVVVAVFLIGYYYLAGVVATIAVFLNMILIMGAMAMLPGATITLPGVAGIVLTIGMAVDANVLIFERLREEQVRGLSLRMALRNAYDRAWSAILDSNVTTGITAAVLVWLGSEEVRGFGLTLLIGIASSLFTALFVTRTLFGLMIDRWGVTKLGSLPLSFPRWDQMLRPNVDWMAKAWAFYAFSGVFIVVGLIAFGVKLAQGQMLDIEFTKGTSVQFDLREPMDIEDVRKAIRAESDRRPDDLPSPNVVAVGSDKLSYEVVTPSDNAKVVRTAVLEALGDKLKVQLPSTFAGVDTTLDAATQGKFVTPIEGAEQKLPGLGNFAPEPLARHVGGVAIGLRDLDPPLSAAQVRDRIEQQRLSVAGDRDVGSAASLRLDVVDVPAAEAGGKPAVLVLASSGEFNYDAADRMKQDQWRDVVAGPMWRVVNEAINKPAGLQKVTNFDAQVASETKRDAFAALTLSVLVIMAYIWARFGNLKYGTATVVALLHDTLFTLAAVGISHYVAATFLGDWLLIEPFRINLTLVAAVLTVMGYSMNDTVVVFDRIRENRGKFGHVSKAIVNDSINQTLSRTLLTGGTTILTIFVMYVFGGSGIHGFTFALLVGILVGTYSSIAIASPILLLGSGREQEATTPRNARAAGQLQRA
jgi:SecD/SecF fusion protein